MLRTTFIAFLLWANPALANDSVAELGAGGLVMMRANSISMQSEDLFVSPSQVRVNYEFRNNDRVAHDYLVAFPMPMINPDTYLDSDVSVPKPDQDNFLNFKLTVEGKALDPQLEMRALSGGLDVTDELRALGIPLNPLATATRSFLAKMPREKLQDLIKKGAIETDDNTAFPAWALKSTYYWFQTFPADSVLHVAHSYVPAVGAAMYGEQPEIVVRDEKTYCVDQKTRSAIHAKLASLKQDQPFLNERTLQYILTTGANWSGAIEKFRLVVDKENPLAMVSFCMDGVTKISATQFEVTKTDFTPDRELDVLILSEMPKN
ncbi:MAG: DUF4424 domain-containing protein [Alphaproteobacteria bacterium]|nr:DUF4424 domain-containing protein [Alphaproteobacteria bacterium]